MMSLFQDSLLLAFYLCVSVNLVVTQNALARDIKSEVSGVPCHGYKPGEDDLQMLFDLIRRYQLDITEIQYPGVSKVHGTNRMQTAYRIDRNANLTLSTREIFPAGLPREFSFICTYRSSRIPPSRWHIFQISNIKGQVEFSIDIDSRRKMLVLNIGNVDGVLQSFEFESLDIFDNKQWHKIHVAVFREKVDVYVDCKLAGSKILRNWWPIDIDGRISIAQMSLSIETVPIDLQWMVLNCDPSEPERDSCDELPVTPHAKSKPTCNMICPQGFPGVDVYRGAQEFAGKKGDRGDPGPQGSKGIAGLPGFPGLQGPPGLPAPIDGLFLRKEIVKGERGEKGEMGSPGLRGLTGLSGEPGVSSFPGIAGLKGDPGRNGLDGFPGMKGEPGSPGLSGMDGFPGISGLRGEKGEPGIRGEQGLMGPMGHLGLPGERGPPGTSLSKADIRDICASVVKENLQEIASLWRNSPKFGEVPSFGPPGMPGSPGFSGPPGEQGMSGETGFRGLPGMPGLPGLPGPAGDKGDKGEAPLECEAIEGPAGPRGFPGPPGNDGMPGVPGDRGSPGRSGSPGLQGIPGPEGPPGTCEICNYAMSNYIPFISSDTKG